VTPNSDKLPEDGQQSLEYRGSSNSAPRVAFRAPLYGMLALGISLLGTAWGFIIVRQISNAVDLDAVPTEILFYGLPALAILFSALGLVRALRYELQAELMLSLLGGGLSTLTILILHFSWRS